MGFVHIYYLHLFKANIADIIGEPKKTCQHLRVEGLLPRGLGCQRHLGGAAPLSLIRAKSMSA
jgi:hypothetical protein